MPNRDLSARAEDRNETNRNPKVIVLLVIVGISLRVSTTKNVPKSLRRGKVLLHLDLLP